MEADISWAENEFGRAQLGDTRRTRRLVKLSTQRAQQPSASFPQSCDTPADLKAAYRFLVQEDIQREQILASHIAATQERMQAEGVVLAAQDTTKVDYTHHPSKQGLGYLQNLQHRGLFLHSTLAITPSRVPLGLIDQQIWVREDKDFGKRHQRKALPIEEKESDKWLKSLKRTAVLQQQIADTLVVSVGDSEADVYDLLHLAWQLEQAVLVRACRNRSVAHEEGRLWAYMQSQPVGGTLEVEVPRQADRAAYTAELEVRWAAVTIKPPQYRRTEQLPELQIWAVYIQETAASAGEDKPISWLLLTNVTVENYEQACERVHWYTCRWMVEMFHKVLKSGCRIEERQFGDYETISRYLAVDSVVAWRVLYLTLVSRQLPDVACTAVLEAHEWQALYCFTHKVNVPPEEPPSLQEAMLWIAKLGGFLGRKGDGEPGMVVVWRGLQRLSDITASWLIFHPPKNVGKG